MGAKIGEKGDFTQNKTGFSHTIAPQFSQAPRHVNPGGLAQITCSGAEGKGHQLQTSRHVSWVLLRWQA